MRRLGISFSWRKKKCIDRVMNLFKESKETVVKMVFGIRETMVKEAITTVLRRHDIKFWNDYSAELDIEELFHNKMVNFLSFSFIT